MKTAIRALVKTLPLTPEIHRVVGLEDQADAHIAQTLNIPDFIETEATEAFLGTDNRIEALKEKLGGDSPLPPEEPQQERQKPRNGRKGLLKGDQVGDMNKAAVKADLSSEVFSEILGHHGYESIMEVKGVDFGKIMLHIDQVGAAKKKPQGELL